MTLNARRKLLLTGLLSVLLPCVGPAQTSRPAQSQFVGSEACRTCHQKEYDGWKKTRMANVIRDPRQHPEAVVADFNSPDPVRSFTLDQVAWVYGSRYKQRYFAKMGDDYYP